MTTVDAPGHENDFDAQLMVEIEAGRVEAAIAMVMALKARHLQTEILSRLVAALDHTLDIRGADTLDLDRARALARARDRSRELAIALDLEHAHALETALDRARTLYLYLDQAAQINRTIIGCLTELTAQDKLSKAKTVRVINSTSLASKNSRGRVITIAVICILLVVGVIALMVLQSNSKLDSAANQQTNILATDTITPTK